MGNLYVQKIREVLGISLVVCILVPNHSITLQTDNAKKEQEARAARLASHGLEQVKKVQRQQQELQRQQEERIRTMQSQVKQVTPPVERSLPLTPSRPAPEESYAIPEDVPMYEPEVIETVEYERPLPEIPSQLPPPLPPRDYLPEPTYSTEPEYERPLPALPSEVPPPLPPRAPLEERTPTLKEQIQAKKLRPTQPSSKSRKKPKSARDKTLKQIRQGNKKLRPVQPSTRPAPQQPKSARDQLLTDIQQGVTLRPTKPQERPATYSSDVERVFTGSEATQTLEKARQREQEQLGNDESEMTLDWE